MKRVVFRVFSLLIIAALLMGCGGTLSEQSASLSPRINPPLELPAETTNFPTIEERHPEVEAEYEPVAENDVLRLYLNRTSSAIIIEDKRSNKLWRSSPAGLSEDKGTTNVWKRQIEVPIQVAFVDADRSQPKNVKPGQSKITYLPVQNGVRVAYTFEADDLALDLVYSLAGDCMNVALPSASIVESGVNSLVSLEILPFFGAVKDGEKGYIVYPDGSGALMRFTTPHPVEVQKITGIVYGSDASGGQATGSASSGIFRQPLPMAVFGLVHNDAGFVGMVTHGDFDSGIALARAGKGISYNHVWSQFVFRRQGRFSLTGGQPAWLYQPDRIPGDRQVRYCFLNGKEATYVGMATRYRDFLIQERGARRIQEEATLMHLGFMMGTERRTWVLRDLITMTTFDQAREILNDLAASGVERLDVTLWLWNKGGVSHKYPQRLPVDDRLGGEEALKTLAETIHQRNQRLFVQDNYFTIAPGARNVFPYRDAVRGVDGLPLGNSEDGYLLNPQIALERFAARDLPKMKPLGVDGIELLEFASMALPDKNNQYTLSREGFAATWMQIAEMSRQLFGSVAMTGSNIYAVPHTDRLDMVVMDSTHYDIFDEEIPLLQIAIHGLVQYTGMPFNLLSDYQRMFLRYMEYGSMPFFIITHESSAKLARTMVNNLYSSQYSYWKDEIIRQYQIMETLAPLANEFIIDHQKLAEGIFQTTYEDGSRIIVNYTNTSFQAGDHVIPAKDFLLLKGE